MLNCNKISLCIIAAILFAGCMEHKLLFDFNKDVNQKFFREIPGIGDSSFMKFPVTKKAENAEIYVSSFREKFIEKEDLLEISELNDSSKISHVDYWDVKGYSQDLYLIKYEFTYTIKSRTGKLIDIPAEGVIFFSVKYNGSGNTLGITPSYFGIINPEDNYINFDTELSLKKEKSYFYLKLHKKKKEKYLNGLLFMPADFPSTPQDPGEKISITKIVRLNPNKIGGYKPLVFDINQIFHDPNALQFHYVNTLHFNAINNYGNK